MTRSLTDEMPCGACGLLGVHDIHHGRSGAQGSAHSFDFIRKEIRALVARGQITVEENESIRCNSYERELMVPALTDEAFIKQMRHCVGQCGPRRDSATYDSAVTGMYAPELLKRFERVKERADDADSFAFVIDKIRAALGQDATHYMVIADDVAELVRWVEKDNCDAMTALIRLRRNPGSGHERTPDGHINNCSLANADEEKNCQICGGNCPERERYQGGLGTKP